MLFRLSGCSSLQRILRGSCVWTRSAARGGARAAWLSEQQSIAMNQSLPPSSPFTEAAWRRRMLHKTNAPMMGNREPRRGRWRRKVNGFKEGCRGSFCKHVIARRGSESRTAVVWIRSLQHDISVATIIAKIWDLKLWKRYAKESGLHWPEDGIMTQSRINSTIHVICIYGCFCSCFHYLFIWWVIQCRRPPIMLVLQLESIQCVMAAETIHVIFLWRNQID